MILDESAIEFALKRDLAYDCACGWSGFPQVKRREMVAPDSDERVLAYFLSCRSCGSEDMLLIRTREKVTA
jgi:hypothetical protein